MCFYPSALILGRNAEILINVKCYIFSVIVFIISSTSLHSFFFPLGLSGGFAFILMVVVFSIHSKPLLLEMCSSPAFFLNHQFMFSFSPVFDHLYSALGIQNSSWGKVYCKGKTNQCCLFRLSLFLFESLDTSALMLLVGVESSIINATEKSGLWSI